MYYIEEYFFLEEFFMKKIIIFTILVSVVAAFAFADTFTVQSVTGRVERIVGTQRTLIAVGDILEGDFTISTSLGASIVLVDQDGAVITIPAARNGTVADLAAAAAGTRIGGAITTTDTSAVSRTTIGNATASARASDAAGDLEFDE